MADRTQIDMTSLKSVMGAISSRLRRPPSPEPIGEIFGPIDDEDYFMKYGKIGKCIIFNNKTFKELDERSGTDVDADQLEQLFTELKFDVNRWNDFSVEKMLFKLQEVANKKENANHSCFVCCILTYGTEDGRLCTKKEECPIQRVYERLYADKCPLLAGKPKMFFIQACPCSVKKSLKQSTDLGKQVSFKIPTNADFLVVYSTVPGVYSWRNSNKGSWFIDALCSTIKEYSGTMDLLQLLSIVNHRVSAKFNSHEGEKLRVQVPCVTSTLTRNIQLPGIPHLKFQLPDGESCFSDETDGLIESNKARVYIFNHETFAKDPMNENSRKGTKHDVEKLKRIFGKPYFEQLDVFQNKEKDDILRELKNVADGSHEEYSCFICCILTHGNYGTLDAYNVRYEIDEILSLFYNKWIGKPKIFIIQACQGEEVNAGIKMVENRCQSTDSDSNYNFRHLMHPDFLIVSSTAPGYFAFRNEDGSWFVQELFKAFIQHVKDKDLLQLLTITNRKVAIERESYSKDKKKNNKKQTLCLTSTLTKNINFNYLNIPN